jgi:hypothetical protein
MTVTQAAADIVVTMTVMLPVVVNVAVAVSVVVLAVNAVEMIVETVHVVLADKNQNLVIKF